MHIVAPGCECVTAESVESNVNRRTNHARAGVACAVIEGGMIGPFRSVRTIVQPGKEIGQFLSLIYVPRDRATEVAQSEKNIGCRHDSLQGLRHLDVICEIGVEEYVGHRAKSA